ncbi:alpha/beta hydrolase [Noviherbaspirillum sp. CPCC 100848]|uniref:Alpha/beta hydrolase n=1 Tax=Noviherbaspirillum album TaxID=3080276 RepID=A0ABU6JI85_9BURK|nr:alpha/beta hydrolase [Noviherbaspirillum sp. CPCC 100848]MEC4723386.1 alpha/beta hydrolase [Noviherbaspirillum sp. CPCC 100848]
MSFIESQGVHIYYERHGSGPAVVFCHGAGSNAATWWQQIPVFARQFTCITIDNRCFGRSAAGLEKFEPELFVEDLLRVMNHENIDRAALICQSMGGMTGLRFALRYPQRVSAFVSCDSPLAIDHPEMLANVERFLAGVEATELEDRTLSPQFVRSRPELAFLYAQINRFNPAVYGPSHGLGWGARLSTLSAPAYLLSLQKLQELERPTLFIVGSEDPVVTPAVVRDVASYVRASEVIQIDQAGHSPYFEQPAIFNSEVLKFLSRHLK